MTVEEMERRFFELKGKLDVGTIDDIQFKSEIEKLKFQDKDGHWWMIGAQSGKWYTFDGARWLPGKPPVEPAPSPPPAPRAEPPPAYTPPSASPSLAPDLPPVIPLVPPPRPDQPTAPLQPPGDWQTPAQPWNPPPPSVPAPSFTPAPSEPAPADSALPQQAPTPAAPSVPGLPPLAEHVQSEPAIAPMPRRRSERTLTVAIPKLQVSGPVIILGAAVIAILAVIVMWFAADAFLPGKPISSFFAGLGGKPRAAGTPTAASLQAGLPPEVAALVAMGDKLMVQSNVDSAMTQYQSAVQLAPSSAIPLVHWSHALAYRGQLQDALSRAQQAIQLAPNDADANAQLCRALAWNGQIDAAIASCEKAVQIDPKDSDAHAYLAEAYLLKGRAADAQTQAQTAVQLAPQSAEAYRSQAWVLTIQGQKSAAVDAWQQTLTLEPNFYFRHFEAAEVLRVYFHSAADAVPEYRAALGLYGAYIPALNRLGLALLEANAPQDSAAAFEHAITLDPQNNDNYVYLGIAFGRMNQCVQGIPYFQQALQVDANNSAAQKALSECRSGKAPSVPAPAPQTVPLVPPALVTNQ